MQEAVRAQNRSTPHSHLVGVYYLQGMSFLLFHDADTEAMEGYLLDQSAVEQICECVTTLAGYQSYFRNYKISGEHQSDVKSINDVFRIYIDWIGTNIYSPQQLLPSTWA